MGTSHAHHHDPAHPHGHDHDHPHDHEDGHHHNHDHPVRWVELARIAFTGVAILVVWLVAPSSWLATLILGVEAALIGGWPIFKEALENLRERRMTMELSMTIALVAALAIGEFVTALVIIFFVLIAEMLEGLTVGRGRKLPRRTNTGPKSP